MSYLNDSSFTLAPEDVEYILQVTAVDADTLLYPGPDSLTGYGKLNAGAALQLVEKPFRKVLHFSSKNQPNAQVTESLHSSGDTIYLAGVFKDENNQNFLPGNYRVNVFRIEQELTHDIPNTSSIIGYWPIPSLSDSWSLFDSTNTLLPRERVFIDSLNQQTAILLGYRHEVLDSMGNTISWWPRDSGSISLNMSYSLLVHDSLATSSELEVELPYSINLYPNPTSGIQKLTIKSENFGDGNVSLFNLQGKRVFVKRLLIHPGEQDLLFDLTNYPSGIYLYNLEIGPHRFFLKSNKL